MILVLGPVTSDAARVLAQLGISITVTSVAGVLDAELAGQAAGKKSKIHIKVETGMGRVGFLPGEDLGQVLELISRSSHIEVEGVFSHFSMPILTRNTPVCSLGTLRTHVSR